MSGVRGTSPSRLVQLVVVAALVWVPVPAPAQAQPAQPAVVLRPIGRFQRAGVVLTLGTAPMPVRAMQEQTFVVEVSEGGKPVKDARVSLDLRMAEMFMGPNRPTLHALEAGRYAGVGIFPRCGSGGRWLIDVRVGRIGKPEMLATFALDLE